MYALFVIEFSLFVSQAILLRWFQDFYGLFLRFLGSKAFLYCASVRVMCKYPYTAPAVLELNEYFFLSTDSNAGRSALLTNPNQSASLCLLGTRCRRN